jgi:DNA-binding GntR family transcriptional regulator
MRRSISNSAVSTTPIERRSLAAKVATQIRDLITEGAISPGVRLNERDLCERLKVSRTPLREAFRSLATEGLIELVPNRGAVVAEMSIEEIEHTFDVLGVLEALSGELACQHARDKEVARIRAQHLEMLAAHSRRDLPSYYKLNRQIHSAINEIARNPVLTETYNTLNARVQSLRFRSNFDRESWNIAMKEHDAMLNALAARDGQSLSRILRQHLRKKRDVVIEQLKRLSPASRDAVLLR